jgi:hypothetical protein
MNLPDRLQKAIVWLGEPASASNFVTEEMLRQLASQGIINYDTQTELVTFTDLGRQVYRELVGCWPKRNI